MEVFQKIFCYYSFLCTIHWFIFFIKEQECEDNITEIFLQTSKNLNKLSEENL